MAGQTRRERERQAREAEIVDAAERVFFEKGFYQASMYEIAAEAQFTKRTVYQYFEDKEDLYYAVALKEATRLLTAFHSAVDGGGTGLEKVRRMGEAYYAFSREHPDAFRLMNFAQYIRAEGGESPHFRKLSGLRRAMFAQFEALVSQGKEDGSIRGDFAGDVGVVALFLMITGFFSRLSEVAQVYERDLGIDPGRIADAAMGLLEQGMGTPQGEKSGFASNSGKH